MSWAEFSSLDPTTRSRTRSVAETALHGHEIETCEGPVEAVHRLQSRAVDVVVTDPETSVREDLALCALLRERRPGVRIIALAPAVSPMP